MTATLTAPPAAPQVASRTNAKPTRRWRIGVLLLLALLVGGGYWTAQTLGWLGKRPTPIFFADYQTELVRRG